MERMRDNEIIESERTPGWGGESRDVDVPREVNVQRGADARRSESTADADEPAAEERIRMRAYEIYQERAGAAGSEVDDWLRAEREYRDQARQGPSARTRGDEVSERP